MSLRDAFLYVLFGPLAPVIIYAPIPGLVGSAVAVGLVIRAKRRDRSRVSAT